MKQINRNNSWITFFSGMNYAFIVIAAILISTSASAVDKVSVASGNYSNPSNWNPQGVPQSNDNITISSSHVISIDLNANAKSVTIKTGATLVVSGNNKLTVHGNLIVNGNAEIMEGDFEFILPNAIFQIGATGKLTWDPANNTAAGATLFTNGVENFHPSSTLIIKKWYNYSNTPLASVITGNFGNLTLSTLSNNLLFEWDQQNYFEYHKILGTLTIDQGWIILDKSGSIKNTFIGAIHLKNDNSYLDFHYGDHPDLFKITTESVTNIGGTMNGLVNGNGNLELEVTGNFENLGKVALIYNSGVQGKSTGNVTMTTLGKFKQTHGDFRGIFNITNNTSGKADFEFGEIELLGGVFMAQYSCHISGGTTQFKVKGNFIVNFENPNAIFRVNGLSSLTGTNSNLQLQMLVDGNLNVNGKPTSEFTTSGSSGMERVIVSGDVRFDGGRTSFNSGSHTTELKFKNNFSVSGGDVTLSKTAGTLIANIGQNLTINSGNLILKGATGHTNLTVRGNYEQTGGSFYLYNNTTLPATHIVYVTIAGDFSVHSGDVIFDNNALSAEEHHLSLSGRTFQLGTQANLYKSTSVQNPVYGIIYYDRTAEMQYHNYGEHAAIKNVKQVISNNCSLLVMDGNLQVSASHTIEMDMLKISGGGTLNLGDKQIYSNLHGMYCGITADQNSRLMIMHENGLYDGSANAAIHSEGNMQFVLHPTSTIEYYGNNEQIITGTGIGNAQSSNQQYGILEINKVNGSARLNSSNVNVRTSLFLNNGELNLNNYDLNILSGKSHAITQTLGYIKSESPANTTGGNVQWKNIEAGMHTIPFGVAVDKIIPLTFNIQTGIGKTFNASTRSSEKNNLPLPIGVTNITLNETNPASEKIIDRWYNIRANGIKADVTLTYLPEENTTDIKVATENFSGMVWNNEEWKIIGGTGKGSISQIGQVEIKGMETWGHVLLIANKIQNTADLLSFEALYDRGRVNMKWVSKVNIDSDRFTVERSTDNYHFESINTITATPGNQSHTYTSIDNDPINGISWYRIKQHQSNGEIKYSISRKIDTNANDKEIELISVGPNPFQNEFTIYYYLPYISDVKLKLMHTNGSIVYQTSTNGEEGRNTLRLNNFNNLSKGLYILSISNGTSFSQTKLLKF